MFKSTHSIIILIFPLIAIIFGSPYTSTISSNVTFIKPNISTIRRSNPLKLFFNIVHYSKPTQSEYILEWNLSFLKTIILESTFVSDDDKTLFLMKFSNIENDYSQWSQEHHDQLERFTEKYFNLYSTPSTFLPFLDCPALTYAITDEMINCLHPKVDEEKRSKIRTKAVERLCDYE